MIVARLPLYLPLLQEYQKFPGKSREGAHPHPTLPPPSGRGRPIGLVVLDGVPWGRPCRSGLTSCGRCRLGMSDRRPLTSARQTTAGTRRTGEQVRADVPARRRTAYRQASATGQTTRAAIPLASERVRGMAKGRSRMTRQGRSNGRNGSRVDQCRLDRLGASWTLTRSHRHHTCQPSPDTSRNAFPDVSV